MEVKINREIREYTEAVFFGLGLRAFVCSMLAAGTAAALYFLLRPRLGTEEVSWLCILGAAPFAALGFVRYHGMTAEQLLIVWLRDRFLEPRQLPCETENTYYLLLREIPEERKGANKSKC